MPLYIGTLCWKVTKRDVSKTNSLGRLACSVLVVRVLATQAKREAMKKYRIEFTLPKGTPELIAAEVNTRLSNLFNCIQEAESVSKPFDIIDENSEVCGHAEVI